MALNQNQEEFLEKITERMVAFEKKIDSRLINIEKKQEDNDMHIERCDERVSSWLRIEHERYQAYERFEKQMEQITEFANNINAGTAIMCRTAKAITWILESVNKYWKPVTILIVLISLLVSGEVPQIINFVKEVMQ